MKLKCKKENWILRALLFLLASPTLILLGLLWWPLEPLEIHSVKIMNEGDKVAQGQELVFEVDYVKHNNMSGMVIRQLLNDRVINYSPHMSSVPKGAAKRRGYLKIGEVDSPGKYQLNYTVIYKYFGFREVVVSKLSNEFEVTTRGGYAR